jgi:hypothetical protein
MAPTIYNFPDIAPNTSQWGIAYNAGYFVSPFSGFTQGVAREGSRWQIELSFNNLSNVRANALRAFFANLNGVEHRFNIHDDSHQQQGTFTGSPRVNGANQAGTSLVTDGWTPGITLRAGNLFSYVNPNGRSELKMITEDTVVDGSGNATIPISPEIHSAPVDDQTIVTSNPVGTFMLADPNISWQNQPGAFPSLSIVGVEDIA